jgi:hypothetical protein
MKLTGAAILVLRGMKVLQAAPAGYPYCSAKERIEMDTKPAVVIGFSVVLASAILAFGPRLAAPTTAGNAELTQVKDELAQLRASLKDELAQVRAAVRPAPAAAGKSAVLKWARAIAGEFLDAVKKKDEKTARKLISPDYLAWVTENQRKNINFELWHPFQQRIKDAVSDSIFDAWSISGEETAPNEVEAKFTGKVMYESENYPFSLLITKGKDSELWRVNLFVVAREREK